MSCFNFTLWHGMCTIQYTKTNYEKRSNTYTTEACYAFVVSERWHVWVKNSSKIMVPLISTEKTLLAIEATIIWNEKKPFCTKLKATINKDFSWNKHIALHVSAILVSTVKSVKCEWYNLQPFTETLWTALSRNSDRSLTIGGWTDDVMTLDRTLVTWTRGATLRCWRPAVQVFIQLA